MVSLGVFLCGCLSEEVDRQDRQVPAGRPPLFCILVECCPERACSWVGIDTKPHLNTNYKVQNSNYILEIDRLHIRNYTLEITRLTIVHKAHSV